MKNEVIYQIFPERFCNGNKNNDPPITSSWNSPVSKNCFMGGDLEGITKKIDYIVDLGITSIYLNPIFQSPSNHKYDTSDYYKIDSHLGSLEDFTLLIELCHDKNIKIIIDGVFNHTSTDFFAFKDILVNQNNSKYVNWYEISEYPVTIKENPPYTACGGAEYLPKLNTKNKEVQCYIIDVIKYWESIGIDGIRLDVPFEIHPSLLTKIRKETKLFLIGEIWGYDGETIPKYFNSVTNYGLRDLIKKAVINQCITSSMFINEWDFINKTYKENVLNLLNLAGSHDTKRIYNLCNGNIKKEKLFYLFLFIMPGIPLIYYGDEIGLQGENDPYCRGCMDWNEKNWNMNIYDFINKLIKMRKEFDVLVDGNLRLTPLSERTIKIERYKDFKKIIFYINFGFQDATINKIIIPSMDYVIL
ncbi:MAG: glycoside hydrolase family 13 protein [Clostridiaceae bacterium]